MAQYKQARQSEDISPVSGSMSPVETDNYPPLSRHQDESQTWLAYDRAANRSSVSLPSQPVRDVPEETGLAVIEGSLFVGHGSSLYRSQTITQTKEQTREKIENSDIKTTNNTLPESSMWIPISLPSGLVILGLVLAVAHHSAFTFLDGKSVSLYSQTWTNRLATGVALIIKMCWSLAVGLAFQHTLWYAFRRSYIKIHSIDKLLNLRSDIRGFLSPDCFRYAPIALALATVSWLFPALPVIVPGTLSVQIKPDGFKQSLACTVPTFGQGGQKIPELAYSDPSNDWQSLTYVGNPTPQEQKIVHDILLGNDIASIPSPCGPNCTYQLVFNGPGLKCEPQPNYMISALGPDVLTQFEVRLKTSTGLDDVPNDWISPGSTGFLAGLYFPIYAAAVPDSYSSTLSTIWVQYLNNDSTSPIAGVSFVDFKPAQMDQAWRTLECTLQNTTYSLDVAFENGVSTINTKMTLSTPLVVGDRMHVSSTSDDARYLGVASALFSSLRAFRIFYDRTTC